jgi:hypothetical protein
MSSGNEPQAGWRRLTRLLSSTSLISAAIAVAGAPPARAACTINACTVETNADTLGGAQTSLRDAITYANANPGTAITFSNAIAGQTITLASELPLILGNNTSINGGAQNTTVSGANTYRAFFVGGAGQLNSTFPTTTATIANLAITNAKAQGERPASQL